VSGPARPLRHLLPFTKGRWGALVGALGATVVVVAAELARPFPLKLVVDALADRAATGADVEVGGLLGIGALVVAIALADAGGTYASELGMRRNAEAIVHDLRVAVYAHLQRLSLRFHDRRAAGDLVTRLTGDVNAVGELFGQSLPTIASSVLLLAGMAAVGFVIDPVLTLTVVAVTPVLALVTARSRRALKLAARQQRAAEGEIAALSEEALSSVRTVKALGSERFEEDRLARTSEERRRAGEATARVEGRFGGAVDVLGSVATAAVLIVGALRVAAGVLTPGDLVVMYSYVRRVYRPLRDLARQAGRVSRAMARAERIVEVLAADAVLPERPDAYAGGRARGALELRDVEFAYDDDRGAALHGASLTVPAGTRLAVVGPSGAGKSTLASLVARFHDPGAGAVLIDGRDLRDCSLGWLRDQVGLVLQDTALFTGTVAENIAYGTDADLAAVRAAARVAGAHTFITELPAGYDTMLGTKGVGLSGGQRQRIAIARAVLRDPPVLLLDEPTSGLDAESEAAVMAGIEALMQGRTTILITHSMALASRCDRVVVLDRGRLGDSGPPGELLAGRGVFRRLAAAQGLASPAPIPAPVDPAFPHLAALFDPETVAAAFDAQFERSGCVTGVTIRYVRYKPGTNLVADYDVATRDGARRAVVMVAADRDLARRAERPAARALAAKVESRAAIPPPLAYLPELDALLQWLPLDVWLSSLAEPIHDLARAARVQVDDGAEWQLLAYKPRRRAVIGVNGHVLKLYADQHDFQASAAALLLGPRLPVPTPDPVGIAPDLRLTAQGRIDGRAVEDPASVAREAGALAAVLHRAPAPAFARQLDPLTAAGATARTVAALAPQLANRLDRLMSRLDDTAPPTVAGLSHGDFHSHQLLITDHGLTLLDLDNLTVGSPSIDLATYAAHVMDGTEAGSEQAHRVLDALVDGYGASPDELLWHFAVATVRRAVFPFRTFPTPDWPERIELMVATADRTAHR
jgi:ABC-type multidrug transport system fused ATPase/permease subunit